MIYTIYHVEKGEHLFALIVCAHTGKQFTNCCVHFYDNEGRTMTTHHLSGESELTHTIYTFGYCGFRVFKA